MKVSLTPDAAQWIEAEVASGAFPAVEDVVEFAISELRLTALRESLDAAETEGGSHSADDVTRYVRDHLDNRDRST